MIETCSRDIDRCGPAIPRRWERPYLRRHRFGCRAQELIWHVTQPVLPTNFTRRGGVRVPDVSACKTDRLRGMKDLEHVSCSRNRPGARVQAIETCASGPD